MKSVVGACLLCATAFASQGFDQSTGFVTSLAYDLSQSPTKSLFSPPSQLHKRNEGVLLQSSHGIRDEKDMDQLTMVQWSADTTKACLKAAGNLKPRNDAGIIACYNMPLLMDSKGVFSADIRLFRISPPAGEWQGVRGLSMLVKYNDEGAIIERRNLSDSEVKATLEATEGSQFTLLEHSQYIGQIDMSVLKEKPDDKQLQAVLTPDIIVSGTSTAGKTLKTEISTEGTKFIVGVFADTSKLTDEETDEVLNAKFELPGTRIEITPIGLYMFSVYMVLGLGIVGWGTWERAKFRDQYRTQLASRGPSGF
ncbi:hypothetical protein EX30DRAFT_311460 [Ascodesmis nigricans]|uniref:Protein BIG1 n=1 Tax=Ascodesmis nigricans TaxID=341454 RepID=A0A4S2MR88_9PEZI|nr:hypothetical protein EX30DRAFT_311460 [Ascodesmis nigricans]